jgi:hypothetical protein
MAASPGSSPATFSLVKTSGVDCGGGYTGQNATAMNVSAVSTGCAGEDTYLQFSTGSFSTFYLFANDAILPVAMTAFGAREIEKQRVRLDWTTTNETGNSHFQIDHSTDGRIFNALGAVAGAGDSFTEQTYDYLHETPVIGLNYYRLRQVDFDGAETLSEIREINVSGTTTTAFAYPNPAGAELRVAGFAGGPVRIIDLQGREVLRRTLGETEALEVSHLPSGIYLLRLPAQTIKWVKR